MSPSPSVSLVMTLVLVNEASSANIKTSGDDTGDNSQISPIPFSFKSSWPGLATRGQLSSVSETPSPSESSHTSPIPLPSESSWPGLAITGQISFTSNIPSPSVSWQTSPSPLPSESSCPGLAVNGQLSSISIIPSPSASLSATPSPSESVVIIVLTEVILVLFSKTEIDFLDVITGTSSEVSSIFWALMVTS